VELRVLCGEKRKKESALSASSAPKKWSTQLYVTEILPPFGRLDDKMVMIVLIE